MRHNRSDITRAIRAARHSDVIDVDFVEDRFDGIEFIGTDDDLHKIRGAMRRYEEEKAAMGEDKLMAESRAALQWAV